MIKNATLATEYPKINVLIRQILRTTLKFNYLIWFTVLTFNTNEQTHDQINSLKWHLHKKVNLIEKASIKN